MASYTLTASKAELHWRDDGTLTLLVMLKDANGDVKAQRNIEIDPATGIMTNRNGVQIGTLTSAQRTALTNLGNGLDTLIASADASSKIPL